MSNTPRVCLMVGILCLAWTSAYADAKKPAADATDAPWADLSNPDDYANKSVQRRKYELVSEFALLLGGLPANPYYKGYSATLGYTVHFNDTFAWEIAQGTFSFNVDTGLKTALVQLISQAGNTVPYLPETQWYVASHFIFKPIYGKQAFFDGSMTHVEAFLQVGPAVVGLTNAPTLVTGGLDWGAGIRIWLTPVVSLRAELGQLYFYTGGNIWQVLHVYAGVGFNIGSDG